MKWSRTFEVLSCQQQLSPQPKALVSYQAGRWQAYSTQEVQAEADRYAQSLWQLGVRHGDRIILVPNLANYQWIFLDLAIQQLGAISVPCHWSNRPDQFQLIWAETEAKLCFFADVETRDRFVPTASQNAQLICLQENERATFPLTRESGQEKADLAAIRDQIKETDLSCIIYTSGTTGQPKGVMLSHQNIVSNIKSVLPLLPIEAGERTLSFLPFGHIFERTILYAYIALGLSIHLAEDRDNLQAIFKEAQPHYFTAVPRILERMYDNVIAYQVGQPWWTRRIMSWALKLGKSYKEEAKMRPDYWFKKQIARILVFNRFRSMIGGKVKAIFTGAAYLQPDLGRLFAAAGIKVREGYGMSETAPIITINQFRPGMNRFGTVGLPVPGVRVVIDRPDENGEGEILVQGPNVMQGYYKRPEETAQTITPEGWLRTGDVGKFVNNRFLKITDRKKDIFKTSSGKYVSPQVLENHFRESAYIEQIMIIGFHRAYVTALIRPSFELLHLWCIENQIHWTSPQYMLHNIKVRQKLQSEIDTLNESLPTHEKVREFHLFHEEWTVETGQLTYTMKLVRDKISEDFSKAIEEMYK
ncbi:MAG: long-chain fatty acid--CoA ligase [Bacteroidota bacterium]